MKSIWLVYTIYFSFVNFSIELKLHFQFFFHRTNPHWHSEQEHHKNIEIYQHQIFFASRLNKVHLQTVENLLKLFASARSKRKCKQTGEESSKISVRGNGILCWSFSPNSHFHPNFTILLRVSENCVISQSHLRFSAVRIFEDEYIQN